MREILIIKFGALGDVLRTTALLEGLESRWPGVHVDWWTDPGARPLIERSGVRSLLIYQPDLARYDLVINLDEDPRATGAVERVAPSQRLGIGRDAGGKLIALNPEAETLVRLPVDDRMKFRDNQKSYVQLIYEALGLKWSRQSYRYIPPADIDARRKRLGITTGMIGIWCGASDRFANKFWRAASIVPFVNFFGPDDRVLLFGGPSERLILEQLRRETFRPKTIIQSVDQIDDLVAGVSACAMLVSGDTLAMHLAVAIRVPVVALFGPTASAEIDLYGCGVKLISPFSCGPCYLNRCDLAPNCMDAISSGLVNRMVMDIMCATAGFSNDPKK